MERDVLNFTLSSRFPAPEVDGAGTHLVTSAAAVGSETSCGVSVCRKQCKTLPNKDSADGVAVNDSYQFHSKVSDLTHGAVI